MLCEHQASISPSVSPVDTSVAEYKQQIRSLYKILWEWLDAGGNFKAFQISSRAKLDF